MSRLPTTPERAMVLAAGLGTRMRPITDSVPKPLVEIAGKTLLDRGLDKLAEIGVETAVVNVHHLAGQIVDHLGTRTNLDVVISDETEALLDSAGGIIKALPALGRDPFLLLNADTFWVDRGAPNLAALGLAWDGSRMDILLMLADPANATGHSGRTDFLVAGDRTLTRSADAAEGMIYAGAAIIHPRIFAAADAVPHSLNRYFDAAIADHRLFGMPMDGHWITVGTPDAIGEAEAALGRLGAS